MARKLFAQRLVARIAQPAFVASSLVAGCALVSMTMLSPSAAQA